MEERDDHFYKQDWVWKARQPIRRKRALHASWFLLLLFA
jgi:hypothetical protein